MHWISNRVIFICDKFVKGVAVYVVAWRCASNLWLFPPPLCHWFSPGHANQTPDIFFFRLLRFSSCFSWTRLFFYCRFVIGFVVDVVVVEENHSSSISKKKKSSYTVYVLLLFYWIGYTASVSWILPHKHSYTHKILAEKMPFSESSTDWYWPTFVDNTRVRFDVIDVIESMEWLESHDARYDNWYPRSIGNTIVQHRYWRTANNSKNLKK